MRPPPFSSYLSPLHRLLGTACRWPIAESDQVELISGRELHGDSALWSAARENRVVPHVAHALKSCEPPASLPDHWWEAHEESGRIVSSYLAEVDALAEVAANRGLRVVGLKNVGIARGLYHCVACCPMGDVDLLVAPKDFYDVASLVEDRGFALASRHPQDKGNKLTLESQFGTGGAEFIKDLGGHSMWLELQWRPIAGRWIRPDQEPRGDEFVSRSVPIAGSELRLLRPEDNLLQVCLHTAKHTFVRAPGFRLHTDVDRIVRATRIDWDLFCQEAESRDVTVAVWLSLAIPAEVLQTPVPLSVLDRLSRSRWRLEILSEWLSRVGLFDCDDRKFSTPAYFLFYALLFDSSPGLARAVVPKATWMKERYAFESDLLLPYFHGRRWLDLIVRRWW